MRRCAMRAAAVSSLSLFVLAVARPAYSDVQRSPQGVYATVDITEYIAGHPKQFEGDLKISGADNVFKALYNKLLAPPWVSGLAIEVHWDWAQQGPFTGEPDPAELYTDVYR